MRVFKHLTKYNKSVVIIKTSSSSKTVVYIISLM